MLIKRLAILFYLFSFNASALVVLQYHHVSDSTPASTSISVEQFTLHMDYLKQNQFNVVDLPSALLGIKKGKKFPKNTVAITFDDGYRNILTNAAPILKQHQFPYTIFVAPEEISANYKNMLSWDQLNSLILEGASIANHSLSHLHLNRKLESETTQQWLKRIELDVSSAEQLITQHTKQQHKILAYPYGEYNSQLLALITKLEFIGIGQHSGAISSFSDFSALPRFPASGRYASLKTLKVKLQSLAMPVLSLSQSNSQLDQHSDYSPYYRPELVIELDPKDIYLKTLSCYILGEKVAPNWLDENRFSIISPVPLPVGRSRYNCTAQSRSHSGYYWFSQPWIQRNDDGTWYNY